MNKLLIVCKTVGNFFLLFSIKFCFFYKNKDDSLEFLTFLINFALFWSIVY